MVRWHVVRRFKSGLPDPLSEDTPHDTPLVFMKGVWQLRTGCGSDNVRGVWGSHGVNVTAAYQRTTGLPGAITSW